MVDGMECAASRCAVRPTAFLFRDNRVIPKIDLGIEPPGQHPFVIVYVPIADANVL